MKVVYRKQRKKIATEKKVLNSLKMNRLGDGSGSEDTEDTNPSFASLERTSETDEKTLNCFGPQTHKKRKIHMSEGECFTYTCSEDGSAALSHPKDLTRNSSKDVNSKLQPVHRKRKKCIKAHEPEFVTKHFSLNHLQDIPGSQGFVSAKDMYDITGKSSSTLPVAKQKASSVKPNLGKKGMLINQSSILNFMKSSPSTVSSIDDQSVVKSDMCSSNTEEKIVPRRSVMYSPIKKLSDTATIYISNSPSSSPVSSQDSSKSSQSCNIKDNTVVKQLFEAQKHVNSLPKHTKPSKSKAATKSKYIDRKPVVSVDDLVVRNSLETDSFDLNAAFNSDIENTCEENDKYGLLGSGHYPYEVDIDYFEQLPPEVLENIFCLLPMLDLCLNSNRVCLTWNSIIADEKVDINDISVQKSVILQPGM